MDYFYMFDSQQSVQFFVCWYIYIFIIPGNINYFNWTNGMKDKVVDILWSELVGPLVCAVRILYVVCSVHNLVFSV